ncbi:MAG: zf-HC2 domain-containing protein [bacterium]
MKNTGKHEIDLLLRSMAKRGQESSAESDGESRQPLSHLDADELNAYAEQALPAATRARYTAHLADCSSCRKIVSDLAMSSGIVTREPPLAAATGSTFFAKLRALLSPPVLRYGVSALALLAAVTFSVISLRQQTRRDASLVAQNSTRDAVIEGTQKPAVNTPQEANVPAQQNQVTTGEKNTASVSAEKKPDGTAKGEVAETRKSLADSQTPASAAVPSNAAKTDSTSGAVAQPSYAPEPPPPAKAQVAANDARKNEENEREKKLAKEKDQGAVVDGVGNEVASNSRSRDEVSEAQGARTKSRAIAAAGRGGGILSSAEARRAPAADAKRSDEDKETPTVDIAGHRFRKQENAWVDTGYDSRATINVTRGSEQYRALVADEPGIRTIADQLHGEVILVWKGRAYRIR